MTLWTPASQAPLSMGFSQARRILECGLLFTSPGDLPDPAIEPSSALAGRFFTTVPPGKLPKQAY